MKPASLGSLFLVDALFLAYPANCAAKANADIDGHSGPSCNSASDEYTADKSHW